MALSDKDILITPNRGQSADPRIEFKGADASSGPNTISLNVYPTNNGTISFEGSAGQLFSVTNSLTGTIFSANDVSGIPSIEVLDTGLIKLGQYAGNVLIGTGTDEGAKLHVNGGPAMTAGWNRTATLRATYPSLVFNSSDTRWAAIQYDHSGSFKIRVGATSADVNGSGTDAIAIASATGVVSLIAGSTVGGSAIVTTGDTGSVTSTMIANGTIVNDDISASASIAVSKLASNTISGVTLGNSLSSFTLQLNGTNQTAYNGSSAVTINVTASGIGAAPSSHTHSIISDITDEHRLFNNMGDSHGTRSSFDASTPSYDFGWRFVQGAGNGPGTSGTQFYSVYVGLGNDYLATGAGSYGMMMAIDRNVTNPYLSIRYNENNSFSTWRKIYAGRADGWTTARTLTIGSTGKSVDGTGNVSWSITEIIPTSTNFQVNSLGVGTTPSATAGEIRATNEITAYFSSDISLKENIRSIDGALDKVCAIGGKYFDWKDDYIKKRGGEDGYFVQKSDFGVIAQDVEKNFPVAVRKREDGTLAVDYEKLCALAFEAIKELREEIDQLKKVR